MEGEGLVLKTDVDDFISFVKEKGKVTFSEASKQLNIPESTIEAWSDFLVEERVLGIEYKFTTAYIYMDISALGVKHDGNMQLETKEEFFEKASKRKIPQYEIMNMWVKYLSLNLERIKAVFMVRAAERGLGQEKADSLWRKYYDQLRVS